MNHRLIAWIVVGTCALCGANALGQEAMYTAAATMPSKNTLLLREQFFYAAYGADPSHNVEKTDVYTLQSTVAIGVERGMALYIDVPLETRRTEQLGGAHDTDSLISDTDFMFKWRVYQDDTGGVDTLRI